MYMHVHVAAGSGVGYYYIFTLAFLLAGRVRSTQLAGTVMALQFSSLYMYICMYMYGCMDVCMYVRTYHMCDDCVIAIAMQ